MNLDELDMAYTNVSMEFSTPLSRIGADGLQKLKSFVKVANKGVSDLLARIDNTHPNGLFSKADDIPTKIKEKKIVYSDYQYLTIFVPSYLRDNASMVEMGKVLEESLDLCVKIQASAPNEVQALLTAYICQPARLQDPILINLDKEQSLNVTEACKATDDLGKTTNRYMSSTGHSSEREFRKVYARINDYYMANDIAVKINNHYVNLSNGIFEYMDRVKAANKVADELIAYIDTNKCEVSAKVAQYISSTMYNLAKLTAWYSATLYNSQFYLKSMQDTNQKIRMVVSS